MRTHQTSWVSVAALILLAYSPNIPAQESSSMLLNSLEVQQLVKRAEPADNARLADHFAALADRYDAEAKRHTSMSQSFTGNPIRNLGTGMAQHCRQLADLNSKSSKTLRDLATYHKGLAVGAAVKPPAGARPFESGAGAQKPTDQELNAMAAKASTPADHRALEDYFLNLAKRDTTEAGEHVALAQAYRGTKIAQAAVHHDLLAQLARDSAKKATAAAEMHKQMAGAAR